MNRLGFTLLVGLLCAPAFAVPPDPKSLEVPTADRHRAQELVRQLGSESYVEREQAHRALAQMGRLAKPALTEAMAAAIDPEIRRRVARLFPKAADDDMKARVAVFLADTEGRYEHEFPGWTAFRKIVGNSQESRALFADMVKDPASATLLAALDGPADELNKRFQERRQEIWNLRYTRPLNGKRRDPTMEDIVVLVLVECVSPNQTQQATGATVATMISNPTFFPATFTGARGEVVKKLLNQWVASGKELLFCYRALDVGHRFELSGTPACAAKLLSFPNATPSYRGLAIAAIAKWSARDYLPVLEKCLGDEVMSTRARLPGGKVNEFHEIRVQDIALAASLIVTGQKPEDYGFQSWAPVGTTMRSRTLPYLLKPEDRAAAFKKWENWRKANPDPKRNAPKPTPGVEKD